MTGSSLWRSFESGDAFLLRVLRFGILVAGIILLGFTGILELTWPQQLVLGLLTVLPQSGWTAVRACTFVTLTLMFVSLGTRRFATGSGGSRPPRKFFLGSGLDMELARRLLHAPAGRRGLRCDPISRLHADDMAAASHSGAIAGRS